MPIPPKVETKKDKSITKTRNFLFFRVFEINELLIKCKKYPKSWILMIILITEYLRFQDSAKIAGLSSSFFWKVSPLPTDT
jgi:hypothetical protein